MEYTTVKKLVRSKSGLRIVPTNDDIKSPFLLCEPPWAPDNETSNCTECKSKFGFTLRRHHCRRCGLIYCKHCCASRLPLPRMSFVDPVRMCEHCADLTTNEQDFFQRHLKTLINGAMFVVDSSMTEPDFLQCKLTQDHRYLYFDGIKQEPVDILQIKSFSVFKESDIIECYEDDDAGSSSSMELVFNMPPGEPEKHLKLTTGPDQYRKSANSWILALQQALKLMYSAQGSDSYENALGKRSFKD